MRTAGRSYRRPVRAVFATETNRLPQVEEHRSSSQTGVALVRLGQESIDVGGELGVMLEQEPVRRVEVNLHRSLRDQARDQVGIVRQDHWVAVAVRHKYRPVDTAQSLQQRVIRDPPGADRVVLRLAGGPGCRLVPVLGPGIDAPQYFLAGLPARR